MHQTTLDEYRKRIKAVLEITDEDLESFKLGVRKVYQLMKDSRWHSGREICEAAGGSEGLRRMRELRSELRGRGFIIERRKKADSREFEYRLSK